MNRIAEDIVYVGVNDHGIDLFEGQYPVPAGMAYNSYLILDEKAAVMDSVEASFGAEWLQKLRTACPAGPDYLVVQHMEPDHSANVAAFMAEYPNATVVATDRAIAMMRCYFGTDFAGRSLAVKEGDTLALGKHTLSFLTAPMVHWPEVMMSYDSRTKTLFSADAFGTFGALDVEQEWEAEARRYYIGIVGKFGPQVQAVLKKAAGLDIGMICPLHGPVLSGDLGRYLGLYSTWAAYEPQEQGVAIAYTSIYGHTREAVELLAQTLRGLGCKNVAMHDLARCDMFEAVADAFRYDRLVLATTTYNGDMFPFMRTFIGHLASRNFQNRTVGLVENGSWGPVAAKQMQKCFEGLKGLEFCQTTATVRAALCPASRAQIEELAKELATPKKA